MERTPDYLDAASNLTEASKDFTIGKIRAVAARIDTSNASGRCWQCQAATGRERRFCNKQCADNWSKENEIR